MKVAFLINGPDEHGVVRATKILADALARTGECDVAVVRALETVPPDVLEETFYAPFNAADIVVIHASIWTTALWGPSDRRAQTIASFCARIRRPVVVYLHDVLGETEWASLIRCLKRCAADIGNPARLRASARVLLFKLLGRAPSLEPHFVKVLDSCVAGFVVSNEVERSRLLRHGPTRSIEVVPHFIERRTSLVEKEEAKKRLNLSGRLVVTLLGFIQRRKGHDLAVSMLKWLPKDTVLIFAGAATANDQAFLGELQHQIEASDLGDRVVITGYLDDEALDLYLSATDVAICPFREAAASGSLATWLAAGRPIVASDLPLLRLHKAEFGAGLTLARPEDASAFARCVQTAGGERWAHSAEMRAIAERYSVERTARHLFAVLMRMSEQAGGGKGRRSAPSRKKLSIVASG